MSESAWDYDRPWHRQPFDTDMSFSLFQRWLLASPRRTQDLLGVGCPYTWTQLDSLAYAHAWRERAALYDEVVFAEASKTIATARSESAQIAAAMVRLATTELTKLQRVADQSGDFPVFQHPHHAIRLASEAHKMARLQEGSSTERVDLGPDLSLLGVEDLRTLRALRKKADSAA